VFSESTFDLVNWALTVMSYTGAPKVHSISYGSPETEFTADVLNRTNVEFQKMAALGYTVFVASGDSGTGSTGVLCKTFAPNFPASSPYVTTVGGTYLPSVGQEEIAVSFSGGGFSNVFDRPSYQDDAVQKYFTMPDLPPQQYYNQSGRGIPDVSALSTNFEVVIENFTGPVSGTSAASPTFAGVISLLNDIRYQQGKSPLGFINPLLYTLQHIGFDVTQGNNKHIPCPEGFPATEGWDAVSGLGTPQLNVLLNVVNNLP